MTSKQRSYLKGLAMTMDAILQIGKSSLTPELTAAVDEALEARELIKIHVLKNCMDDPKSIAAVLGERTRSQVVQVIGKMIVLYRPAKEEKNRKTNEVNASDNECSSAPTSDSVSKQHYESYCKDCQNYHQEHRHDEHCQSSAKTDRKA